MADIPHLLANNGLITLEGHSRGGGDQPETDFPLVTKRNIVSFEADKTKNALDQEIFLNR